MCAGLLALTACLLTACQAPGNANLRVESTSAAASQAPTTASSTLPRDRPFSAQAIRKAILDGQYSAPGDFERASEVLSDCSDCLHLGNATQIEGRTFQTATLVPSGRSAGIAGVAVVDEDGSPLILLAVTGRKLTLTPGQGRTIVAQETVPRAGELASQESGWSVRVYRYHSGRFEVGQRIVSDQ